MKPELPLCYQERLTQSQIERLRGVSRPLRSAGEDWTRIGSRPARHPMAPPVAGLAGAAGR